MWQLHMWINKQKEPRVGPIFKKTILVQCCNVPQIIISQLIFMKDNCIILVMILNAKLFATVLGARQI